MAKASPSPPPPPAAAAAAAAAAALEDATCKSPSDLTAACSWSALFPLPPPVPVPVLPVPVLPVAAPPSAAASRAARASSSFCRACCCSSTRRRWSPLEWRPMGGKSAGRVMSESSVLRSARLIRFWPPRPHSSRERRRNSAAPDGGVYFFPRPRPLPDMVGCDVAIGVACIAGSQGVRARSGQGWQQRGFADLAAIMLSISFSRRFLFVCSSPVTRFDDSIHSIDSISLQHPPPSAPLFRLSFRGHHSSTLISANPSASFRIRCAQRKRRLLRSYLAAAAAAHVLATVVVSRLFQKCRQRPSHLVLDLPSSVAEVLAAKAAAAADGT